MDSMFNHFQTQTMEMFNHFHSRCREVKPANLRKVDQDGPTEIEVGNCLQKLVRTGVHGYRMIILYIYTHNIHMYIYTYIYI